MPFPLSRRSLYGQGRVPQPLSRPRDHRAGFVLARDSGLEDHPGGLADVPTNTAFLARRPDHVAAAPSPAEAELFLGYGLMPRNDMMERPSSLVLRSRQ